jgi:hypothetical protein
MKRYKAIEHFLDCLNDDDVVVLAGKGICKESYKYDRDGYFYMIDSEDLAASTALGLAVAVENRVFVLVDDFCFISELSSAVQIAVSGCKNVFYVVFNSGYYQDDTDLPTVGSNVKTMKVLLYGLGFVYYEFTNYLKNKQSRDNMKKIIDNLKGPTAILINVDKGLDKKLDEIELSKEKNKDRIVEFIKTSRG